MPCDSILTFSVDMPGMNADLLGRALKGLNASAVRSYENIVYFTVDGENYRLAGGQLTGTSGQSQGTVGAMADRLKVGYSHQVVQATAAKYGWALKRTAANKYAVQKR